MYSGEGRIFRIPQTLAMALRRSLRDCYGEISKRGAGRSRPELRSSRTMLGRGANFSVSWRLPRCRYFGTHAISSEHEVSTVEMINGGF